jgi:hypothetical protein
MKTIIGNHRKQFRVVMRLVLILASVAFIWPVSAKPEWDHSKPEDGLFLIDFDKSGHATAVHVIKTTGDAKLDATTIGRLKRWTCKPGKYEHIYVPVIPASHNGH